MLVMCQRGITNAKQCVVTGALCYSWTTKNPQSIKFLSCTGNIGMHKNHSSLLLREKCTMSSALGDMFPSSKVFVCMNYLHTTSVSKVKKKKYKSPREAVTEINVKKILEKESHINRLPVVEIFHNMRVCDIATASKRDIDDVFEVMFYMKGKRTDMYDHPEAVVDDIGVIADAVKKLGCRPIMVSPKPPSEKSSPKTVARREDECPADLKTRPPVVTIMGHVDHGKTTLLDTLRKTNVVASEHGGITQHIGAFKVEICGRCLTFLDTPGHAAFSTMRCRGAQVTDMVVLVIAADDGVMEQTKESIRYAREADVPIVIALNKCDKPEANIERTKRGLMEIGIVPEEFGGDAQCVAISALKGTNVQQLVEAIEAESAIMDLRTDHGGCVEGVVLESKVDIGRGKTSSLLVKSGTLRRGCCIVSGVTWAKVRAMVDDRGKSVNMATPSTPVEVVGWKGLPEAGSLVVEVESEAAAKELVARRQRAAEDNKDSVDAVVIDEKRRQHHEAYVQERRARGARRKRPLPASLLTVLDKTESDNAFSILVKGDVDGSVEALLDVLVTYKSETCPLQIVRHGVGQITESDIEIASTFGGVIYLFNLQTSKTVTKLAKEKNVTIKEFTVIYALIDDIKEELRKRSPPVPVEKVQGECRVLQQFLVTDSKRNKVPVAGCIVTSGQLVRSATFRVIRDGVVIHEGPCSSLKHHKEDVQSIKKGVDCGIQLDDKTISFENGDVIECFHTEFELPDVEWDPGF